MIQKNIKANPDLKKIIDRAFLEHFLEKHEIVKLLELDDKNSDDGTSEELNYLYSKADELRERIHGKEVHLRGIIEFSNYCKCNCYYCGLRKSNKKLQRYQMSSKEIIELALEGAELGYKTIVLQSGEDNYDADKLAFIIRKIKDRADAAITLAVGERDYEEYKLWREKGADRYLLKHETTDKKLYKKLHPGMSFDRRLKCLEWIKELGYQAGSGNIIGLPGQSLNSLADDILFFKRYDLDMIGIGPFISHQETPLKDKKSGGISMTLKVLAVTRLLMPEAHLPATTAVGTIDPMGRQKALKAGANVVMPNITAVKYRPLYEIYPEKICINEEKEDCRQCVGEIINSLGRTVSKSYGHSLK